MYVIIVTGIAVVLGVYYYITNDVDYNNMLTYTLSQSTITNFVYKRPRQRDCELRCTYCKDYFISNYFDIKAPNLFYDGYTTVHRKCHNRVQRKWFNQVMCIFKQAFGQSGWKVIYKHVLSYIRFNVKSNKLR
jgi:hypothetical protein